MEHEVLCNYCKNPLLENATVCAHCETHQNRNVAWLHRWSPAFGFLSSAIALVGLSLSFYAASSAKQERVRAEEALELSLVASEKSEAARLQAESILENINNLSFSQFVSAYKAAGTEFNNRISACSRSGGSRWECSNTRRAVYVEIENMLEISKTLDLSSKQLESDFNDKLKHACGFAVNIATSTKDHKPVDHLIPVLEAQSNEILRRCSSVLQ